MRRTWLILTIALLFAGIGTYSRAQHQKPQTIPPLMIERTQNQADLMEREWSQERASRARSLVADVSAATTTSSTQPTPVVTHAPPTSQRVTSTVPTTAKPTTVPPETTTTTPVTTEVVAEAPDNCGPGKKKWDHAKACYYHLIQQYPWPHARAFEILYCESTGDPRAVSPSGNHWGLMQLDTGPFWDPAKNVEVAYNAYYKPRGNFSKWAC